MDETGTGPKGRDESSLEVSGWDKNDELGISHPGKVLHFFSRLPIWVTRNVN